MQKTLIRLFAATALIAFCSQASAAFSLGGTRLVIASNSSASMEVDNDATSRYGMQAWVEDEQGHDPGKALVVTPGFLAIDGGGKAMLRLLSFAPPAKQEKLYYLNVQEIPPKDKNADGHSRLSLAVRTRIKVLIRAPALNAGRKDAEKGILVSRVGHGLLFHNPTPYYFAVATVSAGGQDHSKTALGVFAPGSNVKLNNLSGTTGTVKLTTLDDYGARHTYTYQVK
ncbi:hypothetical protein EGM70_10505 [Enterobacteriaceae bacterium 89]|nr:hypothetical protein [Enterobacteriaceae bacterium 89]